LGVDRNEEQAAPVKPQRPPVWTALLSILISVMANRLKQLRDREALRTRTALLHFISAEGKVRVSVSSSSSASAKAVVTLRAQPFTGTRPKKLPRWHSKPGGAGSSNSVSPVTAAILQGCFTSISQPQFGVRTGVAIFRSDCSWFCSSCEFVGHF